MNERKNHPVLGTIAYLLVPGERRKKAAGHFRKAGLETAKGLGALARPEKPSEEAPERRRQNIRID